MGPDQHRAGRRRSTTWDHISNVAIDLFAARGFDDVSVDDIAEAAGIARRTLFRYYPAGLLGRIVRRIVGRRR